MYIYIHVYICIYIYIYIHINKWRDRLSSQDPFLLQRHNFGLFSDEHMNPPLFKGHPVTWNIWNTNILGDLQCDSFFYRISCVWIVKSEEWGVKLCQCWQSTLYHIRQWRSSWAEVFSGYIGLLVPKLNMINDNDKVMFPSARSVLVAWSCSQLL